jgi:hypothetical protein
LPVPSNVTSMGIERDRTRASYRSYRHCMADRRWARVFFGLTSAVVAFGLVLQSILVITADSGAGSFESTPARILNYFSFFTVLSNLLVAVTTGMLARNLDRRSTLFRVLRLDAVICIMVTGVVFHLALASLQELTGWDAVADFLLHTLSPILCPLGWLIFGPRGQLSGRVVGLSVVPPIGWLAYALVYGAVVEDRHGNDYYAYPFMNVQVHGYAVALLRCAIVAALFLALAFGASALDRRLPRRVATSGAATVS